jgi:hypothetical protein
MGIAGTAPAFSVAVTPTRSTSEPSKPAAYVATRDTTAGASVAAPARLAGAIEFALRRNPTELALRADSLADQAATDLQAALDAV